MEEAEQPTGQVPLQPELLTYLHKFVTAISTSSIPDCLIGGVALGAWGRPRATHDLDLLVLAAPQTVDAVIATLSSAGIIQNQQWADANPTAKGRLTRFYIPAHPKYPLDTSLPLITKNAPQLNAKD
jgi:hypothetical protein